jgi:ubiquinone/menaquinone biosynthesis C-methylase UbiE
MKALAPRSGERILDIGCGGGETALDLARAVAPNGNVVGIDISAGVLAFARCTADGCERVRFVQADAQLYPFELASFDAAFSRFGVMFLPILLRLSATSVVALGRMGVSLSSVGERSRRTRSTPSR